MIFNMCPRHETCPDAKNGCEKCDIGLALKIERRNYLEQKSIVDKLLGCSDPEYQFDFKQKRIHTCSDVEILSEIRCAIDIALFDVLSRYYNPKYQFIELTRLDKVTGNMSSDLSGFIFINKSQKKKLYFNCNFEIKGEKNAKKRK